MTSTNKKKIALVEKYNQEKLRNQAMKMGVTLKSPETVFLSSDTKFGKNVVINPYVVIGKKTKIGNNVEILPFTHIENAILEENVNVGPFSRIRPGTILSKGSRVGNFVEVKKSKIGINSKFNHLSMSVMPKLVRMLILALELLPVIMMVKRKTKLRFPTGRLLDRILH